MYALSASALSDMPSLSMGPSSAPSKIPSLSVTPSSLPSDQPSQLPRNEPSSLSNTPSSSPSSQCDREVHIRTTYNEFDSSKQWCLTAEIKDYESKLHVRPRKPYTSRCNNLLTLCNLCVWAIEACRTPRRLLCCIYDNVVDY